MVAVPVFYVNSPLLALAGKNVFAKQSAGGMA